VAWVDRDGTAFFHAGTYADNDPRRISEITQFSIGSVTKIFTAALFAQSRKEGKVSWDAPAADFLLRPNDPDRVRLGRVTFLSLATHQGGLPTSPLNFDEVPPPPDDPFSTYSTTALLAALKKHGPEAPVGRTMVYSNFGYAVLGQALASAWGTSYADALRRHVLEPLGMNSTSVGSPGTQSANLLAPDHVAGVRKKNWTLLAFAPAGAVRSTARDLSLFLSACLGGPDTVLFSALQETFQVRAKAEDFNSSIALGWFVDAQDSFIAWHPGATAGSRAVLVVDKSRGRAVAVLANSDNEVAELAFEILKVRRRELTRAPEKVKNANEYAGYYQFPSGDNLSVEAQDGALFVRKPTWGDSLPLRAVEQDRFAVMFMPAEITFERSPSGEVSGLSADLDGSAIRAGRRK
jgi:serine-type D-Ala-D-Ala carboxypeptidase/endopeptidase